MVSGKLLLDWRVWNERKKEGILEGRRGDDGLCVVEYLIMRTGTCKYTWC